MNLLSRRPTLTVIAAILLLVALAGCSSGGEHNGGNSQSPTVSSVSVSLGSNSLSVGQTTQATCTVTMSDGSSNSQCSISSSDTSVASVNAGGDVVTANAAGTTNITAQSTQNTAVVSAAKQLTVTPPSTITGVSVVASPTSVQVGGSTQCTATVSGTGSFNTAVTWSAKNGTISGSGNKVTLTPTSAAGTTASCTATSVQDTSQSGTASVNVTRATPVINSVTVTGMSWFACPDSCDKSIFTFVIDGSGFAPTDKISTGGYWPTVTASSVNTNGTQATLQVEFGANQTPGAWITFQVQPTDGTPDSNSKSIAYVAPHNTATNGPNGDIVQTQGITTYVWQYSSNQWSLAEQFQTGGLTVWNGSNYFISAFDTYTLKGSLVSSATLPSLTAISSTDATGNVACLTQPQANETSLFTPGVANQQATSVPTGTMPYACQVVTVNGTTYAFTASVDATPTLWMTTAAGATVGSQPLQGVTSWSDIVNAGHPAGAWQMIALKSGTYAGRMAFLSTYDQLLLIYDGTKLTLPQVATISLKKVCSLPTGLAAVDSTGEFVVTCLNAGAPDTFVGVDANGKSIAITSTSTAFPNGVTATSKTISVMGGTNAPDSVPNQ